MCALGVFPLVKVDAGFFWEICRDEGYPVRILVPIPRVIAGQARTWFLESVS